MQISFEFSEYDIQIEHKHINDIGTFAIFCLKVFRDGFSINELSEITNIAYNVIKKQLSFLVEKSYIDNSYNLNENGKKILQVDDFKLKHNSEKRLVYFDHYIKNAEYKKIYTKLFLSDHREETVLHPLATPYKIRSVFDDIIENHKSRLIEYLVSIFPEHIELIEENIEEFIFNLVPTNRQFFYNKEVSATDINNLFSDSGTIKFVMPVKTFKTDITPIDNLSKDMVENVKQWFNDNQHDFNFSISLFDGSRINSKYIVEPDKNDKVFRLPVLFDSDKYLKKIDMPLLFFYNVNFSKSCKKSDHLQKMTEENFNELLKE